MPVNIVDLGLVQEIAIDRRRVGVTLAPTYAACPRLLYLHLERHLVHAYGEAGVWRQDEAARRVSELTAEVDRFEPTDGQLEPGIVASNEDLREPADVGRLPAPESEGPSR